MALSARPGLRRSRRHGPCRRSVGSRPQENASRGDTQRAVSSPTIVILEDDHELRALLERGLIEEGFRARGVSTGEELRGRVDELATDALILDIGLPDGDGRDGCQGLRSRGTSAT